MRIFDEIKTGLNEAIEFEKGNLKAKTKYLSIQPLSVFSAIEIKEIRNKTGLTQKAFAECMGVSIKTVEAWEAGRNHPDGASCRLLTLTKTDPRFLFNAGIVGVQ